MGNLNVQNLFLLSNNTWSYHEISYAIYNIFIWFLWLLVKTNQNRLDKEAFYLKYFSVWAYISSWRPQYPLTCHKYSWDRELCTPYLYFMDFAVISLYILYFLWIKVNSLTLFNWVPRIRQLFSTIEGARTRAIIFGINVNGFKVLFLEQRFPSKKIFKNEKHYISTKYCTNKEEGETHSLIEFLWNVKIFRVALITNKKLD